MRKISFLFLLIAILVGASCSGSKSYSKKAKKLENAGLNDEAAQFYLQALQRNPKNVDAKIGLKQTGQIQIENTLTQFYKAYSVDNYREAVYKYQEALSYQKRYGYFVTMEVPPYYAEYYNEMLSEYLDDRYDEANDLMYSEKFIDAKQIFEEIVKLNPEYRNAKDLKIESTIEPLYRRGIVEFESGKYRKCYQTMSEVLSLRKMYKDAFDYKERALENGKITIAVFGFESQVAGREDLAKTIQSDVVSGLTQRRDPFMLVVDRSNYKDLIREQQISVKNSGSGKSSIDAGELLDANILVKATLLSYSSTGGKINSYVRQGFESYQVKKINESTKKAYYETKYRRVTYYEYEGSANVYMEVQYQMISAETGEILRSETVRKEKNDYVNYSTYSGNSRNLYAGKYVGAGSEFKAGDVIYKSGSRRTELQQQLSTSKRTLKSENQLASEAVNSISQQITQGIGSYNPDEH